MKKIALIGAMDEEVALLKQQMQEVKVSQKAGLEFYEGTLVGKNVVIVRCGIGKVNAALCTQLLISEYDVDAVINTGVAGAIYHDLEIGDIVISSDAMHHDFDTTVFGHSMGVIPRMDSSVFKADDDLIAVAQKSTQGLEHVHKVLVGRIVSGDQFVSSKEIKQSIKENFGAYCTEMEGAAIAHVAALNNIPFVILRAISDKADDEADMSFEEFVHIAAKNSSTMIVQMLKNIN